MSDLTATLKELQDGWNANDPDRLGALAATPELAEKLKKDLRDATRALSGLRMDVEEQVIAGRAAAVFSTISGTHAGKLAGFPGTGRAVKMPVATLLHFDDDGKVTSVKGILSMALALHQIGVRMLPPEAEASTTSV